MGLRVGIIGSGNWGTVVGLLAANNAEKLDLFENEVKMWVFKEIVEGKVLSDIINERNENVKYLEGVKLPKNLVASSDLIEVVKTSDVLVFVTPHQFIERLVQSIKPYVKKDAIGVTFIKGFILDKVNKKIKLVSQILKEALEIPVSSMMGANIANQVAAGELSEATLGYDDEKSRDIIFKLYDQSTFRIRSIKDVYGVEICGSIKNIVAIATGFSDGLGLGGNTKALIMRVGLNEMIKFSSIYYKGVLKETFFESCGFSDLITTCFGGRNNKVSREYTKYYISGNKKTWEELEKELLGGQCLQGTLTAHEVYEVIEADNKQKEFPFFTLVRKIVNYECSPQEIIHLQFD